MRVGTIVLVGWVVASLIGSVSWSQADSSKSHRQQPNYAVRLTGHFCNDLGTMASSVSLLPPVADARLADTLDNRYDLSKAYVIESNNFLGLVRESPKAVIFSAQALGKAYRVAAAELKEARSIVALREVNKALADEFLEYDSKLLAYSVRGCK